MEETNGSNPLSSWVRPILSILAFIVFEELPYTLKISKDKTVDGKDVFLAIHPELIGCMAQGITVEEAVGNLKEVTYEYILSLLEDRVPIPVPSSKLTTTTYITTVRGEIKGNKP